jgi:nicotinamide-nucleotide amidase
MMTKRESSHSASNLSCDLEGEPGYATSRDRGSDRGSNPDNDPGGHLAAAIGAQLMARGWTITAAESCTGGLFAAALTEVPGSSGWFNGSFVTYANSTKQLLTGVPPATLEVHGAVSKETVVAMSTGAASAFGADVAIAISGIAGPDGGVPGKPVGTVWICLSVRGSSGSTMNSMAVRHQFSGDRQQVRDQAVSAALSATLRELTNTQPFA